MADSAPKKAASPAATPAQADQGGQTQQSRPNETVHSGEHVLGHDPARTEGKENGFHDSMTGKAVTEAGEFVDPSMRGQGPIPKHRIVANNWPQEREKIDAQADLEK